ncbi:MAG: hypothetical protein Q8934_10915 [Bacillota bacterium]|nr:hypothetical protein [Bacillota bacterium]
MSIFKAEFKVNKEVDIQKSNLKELYISRIPKIMKDKSAAAVVEKLANHIDRVENIQHEIAEKQNELIDMREQSATLQKQYQEGMDRKILRAKIELDAEIDIQENEIKVLYMKKGNKQGWKIETLERDLDVLASAYNPLAERELKLYESAKKTHEQFVQARSAFLLEHKANHDMYSTLSELALRGTGKLIEDKLDRISTHKADELY